MALSPQKIKVVHSFPVWLPQTQTWMYNQVRYLPKEIKAHIVCERTENLDQFEVPNIHALRVDASVWRRFWDKGLQKLGLRCHLGFSEIVTRRHEFQILHSHFGNTGWANIKLARKHGLRHVVTFYGQDVNRMPRIDPRWHDRYQNLFDHVDQVLCEGPYMARCIVQMGCPEHKVKVHHLGVRIDEIDFKPRNWHPSEPLRVLMAASFREKKGFTYALQALGRIQNKLPLEITIIGDANQEKGSQQEKRNIMSVIEKHNLTDRVRLLGYQSHKVLFEQAYENHVFLSPSVEAQDGDTEGGAPVSLIEMAASGMPIVSTYHCDIPEVLPTGTAFLAKERDVEGIVQHLQALTETYNHWQPMLQAARERMEREYDARKQGVKLGAIYQRILSKRSHGE